MERDFVEILSAFNASGAEYLVVGAHALAAHGVPRVTGRPKDLLDAETLAASRRHD